MLTAVVTQLGIEERRNACGPGRPWQLIDGLGTALGIFFGVDASRRLKHDYDAWAVTELMLAATMIFIHSTRFFYEPVDYCAPVCGLKEE